MAGFFKPEPSKEKEAENLFSEKISPSGERGFKQKVRDIQVLITGIIHLLLTTPFILRIDYSFFILIVAIIKLSPENQLIILINSIYYFNIYKVVF